MHMHVDNIKYYLVLYRDTLTWEIQATGYIPTS